MAASSARRDLVHFNLGMARHPMDHPEMAGFANQVDVVNLLAEKSPGFVWMAADGEAGDAAAVFGNALALANISTWRSVGELRRFVYSGLHGEALSRRRDWFEPAHGHTYVLWWVPIGHRPTWIDARQRLQILIEHGPTAEAFTFKTAFDPDGRPLPTDRGSEDQPNRR